eukprot:TRINITY_DN12033_c0_g1_i1.p1 TRINITY_DN12033_c0_g1~~TRINITY_DN12033_c0_g1_i1.p1  ORF type:complete len:407 (+),score=96.87 TRINITY_DN12033_c0_g1_i1:79-1299(+)
MAGGVNDDAFWVQQRRARLLQTPEGRAKLRRDAASCRVDKDWIRRRVCEERTYANFASGVFRTGEEEEEAAVQGAPARSAFARHSPSPAWFRAIVHRRARRDPAPASEASPGSHAPAGGDAAPPQYPSHCAEDAPSQYPSHCAEDARPPAGGACGVRPAKRCVSPFTRHQRAERPLAVRSATAPAGLLVEGEGGGEAEAARAASRDQQLPQHASLSRRAGAASAPHGGAPHTACRPAGEALCEAAAAPPPHPPQWRHHHHDRPEAAAPPASFVSHYARPCEQTPAPRAHASPGSDGDRADLSGATPQSEAWLVSPPPPPQASAASPVVGARPGDARAAVPSPDPHWHTSAAWAEGDGLVVPATSPPPRPACDPAAALDFRFDLSVDFHARQAAAEGHWEEGMPLMP